MTARSSKRIRAHSSAKRSTASIKSKTLLGKGGMGAVYRARHILLGDRVAIKVLPPEMRSNTEWLRRFQREGQAARRFRHPNAVTVYDLRTSSDGTIYLVMEYVEGNTLDVELRKRGRFSPGGSGCRAASDHERAQRRPRHGCGASRSQT